MPAKTIADWLTQIGLPQYAELFAQNEIDLEVLPDLGEQDLEKLGIPLGHRKKLLKASSVMQSEVAQRLTERPPGSAAEGQAERRQLTVMFCDLVGSTLLSQQLDPEQLRELMRAYQQACGGVVEKYDGHVAQYLGDGLMVYFGWPRAHEDDAVRAIRAGLEVTQAVSKLKTPTPIRARVGIHTGLVVVGETGHGDASIPKAAVGETPNIAARLQALAEPSTVVLSERTRGLAGGLFDYADLGARVLKGVAEPMHLFQVVRARATDSRFEAAHGGVALTPLVGREEEVALLLRRWQQARDGEGQVVLVSGEPGIGKSRLTQVLREQTTPVPHRNLRYQCSPYHVNSALHPVIEQIAFAAGFTREDTPEQKLDKMQALLVGSEEQIAEAAPLFAALLSLPTERYPLLTLSPQKQKEKTLDALAGQLEALSQRQPLLMVYEDVHWIDPTSREALDVLLPRLQSLPILLVITYRTEYTPPWTEQAHITTLGLSRLGRRLGAELVAKVSGGKALPQQVLEQIVARTDGVPLFVEELTKSVLESKLLRAEGDGYVLDGPLPALAIPATLRDSLIARLDRLAQVRELAQIGACIGREFSYELLAALSPLKGERFDEALEQLTKTGLVFRRGTPPDASYTFKHALVQDAAYDSLLKSKRAQLHTQVVHALQRLYAGQIDDHMQELAYHAFRAEQWEQASRYSQRAGTRAFERSANREAVAWLEQGLAALEHLPETVECLQAAVDLHIDLRNALEGLGAYDRIPEHLHKAEDLATKAGDQRRLAWVLGHQADSLIVVGRDDLAQDIARRALKLADEANEVPAQIIASQALGLCLYRRGQLKAGIASYKRALDALPGYEHSERLSKAIPPAIYCRFNLSWPHAEIGDFREALRYAEEALEIGNQLRHPHGQLLGHYSLAEALATRGEFAKAIAHGETTLALIEETGIQLWFPWLTMHIGPAYALSGQAQRAISLLERGLAALEAMGATLFRSWILAALTEAHLANGDLETAQRRVDETLQTADQFQEHGIKVRALRLCAEVVSLGGVTQARAAVDYFEASMKLADELELRPQTAHCHLGLARHYQRIGEHDLARQHLSAALSMYREMHMRYWPEQAEAELNRLS